MSRSKVPATDLQRAAFVSGAMELTVILPDKSSFTGTMAAIRAARDACLAKMREQQAAERQTKAQTEKAERLFAFVQQAQAAGQPAEMRLFDEMERGLRQQKREALLGKGYHPCSQPDCDRLAGPGWKDCPNH